MCNALLEAKRWLQEVMCKLDRLRTCAAALASIEDSDTDADATAVWPIGRDASAHDDDDDDDGDRTDGRAEVRERWPLLTVTDRT